MFKTNMKLLNVGFGNYVSADRIVAIATPDSEPVKRLIRDSKDYARVIDVSCGKRTRAVIITDSEHVILSSLSADKLSSRISGEESADGISEDALSEND